MQLLIQTYLFHRHHRYAGPNLDLEMSGNYVSRLECAKRNYCYYKQLTKSFCRSKYMESQVIESEEDQGAILAGGLARDILSENLPYQ